jgi:hypothetical protein
MHRYERARNIAGSLTLSHQPIESYQGNCPQQSSLDYDQQIYINRSVVRLSNSGKLLL